MLQLLCRGRINPSDNVAIDPARRRSFHLSDDLSLTVDPSIQYVLAANGGGYTSVSEQDPRLAGSVPGIIGRDLNGDGDVLDNVGVYTPNNTNTIRYGLNTSLVWRVNQDHTVQLAYTGDFGYHRQTAQIQLSGFHRPSRPIPLPAIAMWRAGSCRRMARRCAAAIAAATPSSIRRPSIMKAITGRTWCMSAPVCACPS